MPFKFADGILVPATDSDEPQVRWPSSPPTSSSTTSTADDETTTDPWPLGAVVRFQRPRGSVGHGQIAAVHDNHITIRTWLPCATRTVVLPATAVTLIARPGALHAWLTRA